MIQAGSDIAKSLISKRGNRKSLSFPVPAPAAPCESPAREGASKRHPLKINYNIYRFMISKTELADENPRLWPSSIVPNTSLSVYSFGPNSGGFWQKDLS